ncbi:MAG: phosphopantetheine-binding protein [Schaalia hyovaginalis]|uniref:phosphopantetheine-binding protein n=1 Tax=Schaalia TaxID=2529408 RepID=UPI0026E99500|nr:phosphopantetheine-binding protein [Schaalia hyovaginalis]MCI6411131.1 phosphopantetheine-binding protein [Schaalia hyovaginalis]MCI6557458.1 phosphopantetheine-binding protein [Schaalia hyovaginalis]MDY3666085.1 phosphopantetheine-binding protein [Schaalia hyovaginalis]MDY4492721.1 phosphopantetheine-binding protein [Schaalia hyovaginalis]MDY6213075.1 phosphopantetheine-binding protein [Schaalia hyovaginalis]
MGSIAELLGYSLLPEPDAAPDDEAPRGAPAASKADLAREAAMAAVLEETGLDPDEARADLTLRGDLDLDDLGLYAIVARIEHDLSLVLPDELVDSWGTLGSILDDTARLAAGE